MTSVNEQASIYFAYSRVLLPFISSVGGGAHLLKATEILRVGEKKTSPLFLVVVYVIG